MSPPIREHKARLRRELRLRLTSLDPARRDAESARIRAAIRASPQWASARRILAFVALASEPDLLPLLHESSSSERLVCVPRWNPHSETYEAARLPTAEAWATGPFGVPEPDPSLPSIPLERLDLVLVPGLGFDRRGWRLGRGRGFFDRLLRQAVMASRWGVAFDLQIVDQVPYEPHDVNVHILVTPQLGLLPTP